MSGPLGNWVLSILVNAKDSRDVQGEEMEGRYRDMAWKEDCCPFENMPVK